MQNNTRSSAQHNTEIGTVEKLTILSISYLNISSNGQLGTGKLQGVGCCCWNLPRVQGLLYLPCLELSIFNSLLLSQVRQGAVDEGAEQQ